MERRLFDFFNEKFEEKLPGTTTMQGAFDAATNEVKTELRFQPYSSFESFIALRKRKNRKARH